MRLREYGAKQICPQEYKHWRESGVAFTFPEFEYTYPNKTFVVDLKQRGKNFYHRGYVGDMAVGPFISFGLVCPDEKMMVCKYGTNQCRATDVTERNLYEIFWELTMGEKYDSSKDNKNFREYGAVQLQLGNNFDVHKIIEEATQLEKYEKPLKKISKTKIHFLSLDDVLGIQKKPQFQGKFDIVSVASNYFPFLKEDFKEIFAEKSLVLFETKKYSILKRDLIQKGIQDIKDYSKNTGVLEPITCFNVNAINSIIKYKK